MRISKTFLALTGLCGVVLTCLIGWAEDARGPATSGVGLFGAPASSADALTEKDAERYSRSRNATPTVINFRGGFPDAKTDEPAGVPGQPLFPMDPPQPAHPTPIGGVDLVNGPYGDTEFPVAAPPPSPFPTEQPAAPVSETNLFPAAPMPATGNAGFNPNLVEPAPPVEAPPEAIPTAKSSAVAPVDFPVQAATGPQTAQVSLEWIKRTEINVGQECQCDLQVKNTGEIPARNVSVIAEFPASGAFAANNRAATRG